MSSAPTQRRPPCSSWSSPCSSRLQSGSWKSGMRLEPETDQERAGPDVEPTAAEPDHRGARYGRLAIQLVPLTVAVVLPFILDNYWVFTLTEVMIYAIATIGLD